MWTRICYILNGIWKLPFAKSYACTNGIDSREKSKPKRAVYRLLYDNDVIIACHLDSIKSHGCLTSNVACLPAVCPCGRRHPVVESLQVTHSHFIAQVQRTLGAHLLCVFNCNVTKMPKPKYADNLTGLRSDRPALGNKVIIRLKEKKCQIYINLYIYIYINWK